MSPTNQYPTKTEFKEWFKLTTSATDDAAIDKQMEASIDWAEKKTHKQFSGLDRELTVVFDADELMPCAAGDYRVVLDGEDPQTVTQVAILDRDGTTKKLLTSSEYYLNKRSAVLTINQSLASDETLKTVINYKSDPEERVNAAIILHAGHILNQSKIVVIPKANEIASERLGDFQITYKNSSGEKEDDLLNSAIDLLKPFIRIVPPFIGV